MISGHSIRRICLNSISKLILASLPSRHHIRLERKLRGWDEYKQIMASEYVVISYGKSGRTWLRNMISAFFFHRFDLKTSEMIRTDNYRMQNGSIPVIFFTHNEYIDYFADRPTVLRLLSRKKILLLLRDPRDVSISMYFHCQYRMKRRNKKVNQFTMFRSDMPIFDFLMDSAMGLPATIAFSEQILQEIGDLPNHKIVRYEDLKGDPKGSMRSVIEFLGFSPTEFELDECIASSTLEKMRSNEREGEGSKTVRKSGENSLKTRRGVVGGFVDYLTPGQQSEVNIMVRNSKLGPLGYK